MRRCCLPITSGSVTVSPKPGWKPSRVKLAHEARLRAGDAEVRHHREPEPAADRRAVDRADDRLLRAEQPHRLHVEVADRRDGLARPQAGLVERRAVAEIRAGAERFSLRGEHDGAAFVVLVEGLERVARSS